MATIKKKMQVGGKVPKTPKQKSFAALAEPKNRITAADRIAGATAKSGIKMKAKSGASMKKCKYGCN